MGYILNLQINELYLIDFKYAKLETQIIHSTIGSSVKSQMK